MMSNKIASLEDVFALLREHPTSGGLGWWYRGQSNAEWVPVPRAFRFPFYDKELLPDADLVRFLFWKRQAVAYINPLPEDDLDCLAIAQHHGLATRLLDWTGNLLAAIFFAVVDDPEKDGAVFAFKPKKFFTFRKEDSKINRDISKRFSKYEAAHGYLPPAISERIVVQKAAFTIHRSPEKPFEDRESPVKFIVPKSCKKELIYQLDNLGVNYAVLFPDLDGYCRYQNWLGAEFNRFTPQSLNYKHAQDLDESDR